MITFSKLDDIEIVPDTATIHRPSQKENRSNKHIRKGSYNLRRRVARWATHDIDEIKKFSDNGKATYVHLTDPELWAQREWHYLLGVRCLLHKEESDDYFFKTKQGKYAVASMTLEYKDPNKPKEIYSKRILEIGIDRDEHIIYHMMFNPKKKIADLKQKAINAAMRDCTKKVKDYVIVYTPPAPSPYASKTLYIHPKGTKKEMINGCK